MNPLRTLELLQLISDEDAELLWMDNYNGPPENLIVRSVIVPPVPIRPSVPVETGGAGSNEDDITIKLQEIIDVNNALRMALEKGATIKMVTEDWEFLQIQVFYYPFISIVNDIYRALTPIFVIILIYVRMYLYLYVFMYVCMYVCMFVF